jgi:hypothetical protein
MHIWVFPPKSMTVLDTFANIGLLDLLLVSLFRKGWGDGGQKTVTFIDITQKFCSFYSYLINNWLDDMLERAFVQLFDIHSISWSKSECWISSIFNPQNVKRGGMRGAARKPNFLYMNMINQTTNSVIVRLYLTYLGKPV